MTFSETANVSALYRQQKHTQARLRIYNDDSPVPIRPDVKASGPRTDWVQWAEKVVGLRQQLGAR